MPRIEPTTQYTHYTSVLVTRSSPKETRIEAARIEAARIEAARIEAARTEAARTEAARKEKAKGPTLQEALDDYLAVRLSRDQAKINTETSW